MFKSPLMNGSAFFIFCSKVVRLTTMMVDPFDALAPAIQGWESIGAISPKTPPWPILPRTVSTLSMTLKISTSSDWTI